jgi:hypothetical protein
LEIVFVVFGFAFVFAQHFFVLASIPMAPRAKNTRHLAWQERSRAWEGAKEPALAPVGLARRAPKKQITRKRGLNKEFRQKTTDRPFLFLSGGLLIKAGAAEKPAFSVLLSRTPTRRTSGLLSLFFFPLLPPPPSFLIDFLGVLLLPSQKVVFCVCFN